MAGGQEAPLVRGDGDLRHVGLWAGGEDGAVREAPHVDVVTLRRHQDAASGGEGRGRDLHRRHAQCELVPRYQSLKRRSILRFIIMEKAPTRAFSLLKAPTSAFTFKTLLRHYANQPAHPLMLMSV